MKNQALFSGMILMLLINTSCNESKNNQQPNPAKEKASVAVNTGSTKKNTSTTGQHNDPLDFIPKGFVLFDQISGDLNKDGINDLVLIIKGTDKSNLVQHEFRGELDRNRRGIIILFKKENGYEPVLKNLDCFSSENEEGGVYYAPELSFSIEKGNLYVQYAHGRYGYWKYTFKYRNADFELIGYDSTSTHGPVVESETSINFLTKRKLERRNVSEDPENEEIFKETWTDLKSKKMIKLSEIADFDELRVD